CTGTNPIVCSASDQCHVAGTCSGGVCSNPAKPDGDGCDDGNACTQTDTCQAGSCTGANPVVCTAPACHTAGTCDTGTGICSAPTVMDDGSVCSGAEGGRCSVGSCVATFMVVRVGDGGSALANTAAPVFVERRYLDPVGAIV